MNGEVRGVAVVTGAARNIGREIALELAAQGCDVAINDYADAAGAEAVASEIRALGRRSSEMQLPRNQAVAPSPKRPMRPLVGKNR